MNFGAYITERKTKGPQLNGMAARYCRQRGYKRTRGKFQFFRHTLGVGGVYVDLQQDSVRVRAKELGIDRCFEDRQEFRLCLDDIDAAEENLVREWTAQIYGNQSQITTKGENKQ